jgi:hypothetical protein
MHKADTKRLSQSGLSTLVLLDSTIGVVGMESAGISRKANVPEYVEIELDGGSATC